MRWKVAEDAQGDVLSATKPVVGENTSRKCPWYEKTVSVIKKKASKKSSLKVIKKLF
jgi:hypothetical protein